MIPLRMTRNRACAMADGVCASIFKREGRKGVGDDSARNSRNRAGASDGRYVLWARMVMR